MPEPTDTPVADTPTAGIRRDPGWPWGYLSPEQIDQLLRGINPRRVNQANGYSHIEAYEVRAHLNRIFGFARWDLQVRTMELVFEEPTTTRAGKDAWYVAYRAQAELLIRGTDGNPLATYTEWATGDSTQPQRAEAHDMALKTAESQALKRCAANLGDQFGLSLYNNGSVAPLVRKVLNLPELSEPGGEAVDAHIVTTMPEDAPQATAAGRELHRETSTPPPVGPPPPPPPSEAAMETVELPDVVEERDPEDVLVDPANHVGAQEAIDNVREMFPGAAQETEAESVAEISAMVTRSRQLAGEERLAQLKEALELAVRKGLRQHRLVNGVTVGAALTREIAEAAG